MISSVKLQPHFSTPLIKSKSIHSKGRLFDALTVNSFLTYSQLFGLAKNILVSVTPGEGIGEPPSHLETTHFAVVLLDLTQQQLFKDGRWKIEPNIAWPTIAPTFIAVSISSISSVYLRSGLPIPIYLPITSIMPVHTGRDQARRSVLRQWRLAVKQVGRKTVPLNEHLVDLITLCTT